VVGERVEQRGLAAGQTAADQGYLTAAGGALGEQLFQKFDGPITFDECHVAGPPRYTGVWQGRMTKTYDRI
jgi:hypothetical protein